MGVREASPGRWLWCGVVRQVWVVGEHIAEGIFKEFVVPFESTLPVIFFCDSGVVSFFELLAGNCCCSVGCNGSFLAVG